MKYYDACSYDVETILVILVNLVASFLRYSSSEMDKTL